MLFGVVSAVYAGLLPTAALGGTNLYAPYSSSAGSVLSQFAVAPDGSLSALAPVALDGFPEDIAITPDGRFAYVTLSLATGDGSIAQFARDEAGHMEPVGSVDILRAGEILVDPQGSRVFYTTPASAGVRSRPILADGRLGGENGIGMRPLIPASLAMTPSGRTLYIAIRGPNSTPVGTPPRFLQNSVDPETGTLDQRAPGVPWPAVPAGADNPDNVMHRMTLTPDGRHLYGASGGSNTGIARFAIDAEVLGDGSIVGVPSSHNGGSVAPVSPDGRFLWAPTSTLSPGQIDQFSIDAAGGLSPLSPASAPYTVDAATRDAVASPDGRTLYLGQDANLGVWSIAAGTLTSRANLPIAIDGATNAGIALAPSQAPVASLTVEAQPAGSPTTFDAGGSSDPDGSIVRYDWSFGDGMTLADGGATPSHVYTAPGAHTMTLTVTDADGTSTSKLWTGTQMLRNGGPSAQTTRTVTIPATALAPPPPPAYPPPTPHKGKSVTIEAVSGRVSVKLPGSGRYVAISRPREIVLGSTIDARKGRVRVTAEVDATTHRTQSSLFYEGIFMVRQTLGSKPILVATLVGGSFAGCAPRGASGGLMRAAAGKKRSKRKVRRLWANAKGDFRTSGKHSSATTQEGSWWLVEDRCDGTLTHVKRRRVDVRDFTMKTTIRLRAGKRFLYLAKAP